MPKNPEPVGCSQHTGRKQADFRALVKEHVDIVRRIIWKHRFAVPVYLYVDLCAGPGESAKYGDGSPLIFITEAEAAGVDYSATFIEADADIADSLYRNISCQDRKGLCRVLNKDHNNLNGEFMEFARLYGDQRNRKFYGMVYADANGVPPFDVLSKFSKEPWAEKLDIVINTPATAIKRCLYQSGKHLTDHLSTINKKFWVVRAPVGRWQWTMIVGTNWAKFPELISNGFYRVDSEYGQALLDRINHTATELEEQEVPYRNYREYLAHPRFRAVREVAMTRANGVCEKCGQRKPTEVHHLQYPPWGTFDSPDNLIAICHQCHCEIHGKEN